MARRACAIIAADLARGCGAGQLGTRSSPCRRPRLACTDSAAGRRQGLCKAFESHDARTARISHCGASVGRRRAENAPRAPRTWPGCIVGQLAACSSSRRRPRLDRTNSVTGQRLGHRRLWSARSTSVARVPRTYRTMEYRPTARRAGAAHPADLAHGCGAGGQGAVHLFPRRRPRLACIDGATGLRRELRKFVVNAFESHDARRAHIALWSIGRRRAEHALRAADLA